MILLVDLSWKPGSLSRDEFVGPVARIVSGAGQAWGEAHFSGITGVDLEGADGIILCGTALKDNLFSEKVQEFLWLREVRVPGPWDLRRDAGPLPRTRGHTPAGMRDRHDHGPGHATGPAPS